MAKCLLRLVKRKLVDSFEQKCNVMKVDTLSFDQIPDMPLTAQLEEIFHQEWERIEAEPYSVTREEMILYLSIFSIKRYPRLTFRNGRRLNYTIF